MAQTSIYIQSTNGAGKSQQKAVTFVNSKASNEDLVEFGRKAIAFTTHTYVGTTRIDKIDCDTSTADVPTITLGTPTYTKSDGRGSCPITAYTGKGNLFATVQGGGLFASYISSNTLYFGLLANDASPGPGSVITINVYSDDGASASAQINL